MRTLAPADLPATLVREHDGAVLAVRRRPDMPAPRAHRRRDIQPALRRAA